MTQCNITLQVRVAWWVRWYLAGVALVAFLTGLAPNWVKVLTTVMNGLRVQVR